MPRLLVQEAPAPTGQRLATPEAFGAGVGRAMQQTGQVAQALGEVMNQYAESQGRAQAIRYEQELEAEANRISLDPDIAGRGEKFEQAQRRLQERFRPKIGGRASFDQRSDFATRALRSKFDHQAAVDGINEARLNTDLEVTHKAIKMSEAADKEDIGASMLEIRESIQAAGLLYTPAEQTQKIQDAYGTALDVMSELKPVMALEVMKDFAPYLKPEVITVYREKALRNIREGVALENAERRERERLDKEAAKAQSDAAEDELFDLQIAGGLTLGAVAEVKDRLSPAAQRRWYDRAKGRGGDAAANPNTFMHLTDRAEAGDDIREDATLAAESGEITAAQRNALVKTSRDARFKPGRDAIRQALDPGAFRTDFDMGIKRTNAIVAFDEWVRENPGASYEESMGKANELIRIGAAQIKTGVTVKTADQVKTEMRELVKQRDAGLISPDQYRTNAKKLTERLREIEALEAATAAGGGAR